MGEALGGLKRTMMCGEPREANIGSKDYSYGMGSKK